jgi:CBS domain-containing protein
MSGPPISVGLATTLRDCMVLMTKNHIRHLPVIEADLLRGVVSIGDVVSAIISEQDTAIEDLESYISGNEYTNKAASS